MVKDMWDASISERRQIVKKYEKSKQLSEEIANIEEKYGKWIGELAGRFEEMLYLRSHCWCLMTLAELRAWNEGKAFLTDEEKQLYAARSGCSYDVFEELASERLMHLEITSWRQKSNKRKQADRELRLYLQELEKKPSFEHRPCSWLNKMSDGLTRHSRSFPMSAYTRIVFS